MNKGFRAKSVVGLHTHSGFLTEGKAPIIPELTSGQEFNAKANRMAGVVAVIFIAVISGFILLLQYAGYIG